MAHEALIVVGFGVALAVASVALFVAHVKRINAPNRADPTGTTVRIDLGAALARDEDARNKRVASRGSSSSSKNFGETLGSGAVREVFALQQSTGRRRRRRPASATWHGDAAGRVAGREGRTAVIKGGETSAAEATESRRLETPDREEPRAHTSTMVLPSPLWAEAIVKHAEVKRKQLRSMVKSGEAAAAAAGWEAKWERLPPPRRRRVLEEVREELLHAVSAYVGRDDALFEAVCPNLSVAVLEESHRGISGLSRLVRDCVDGKLPEPRSRAYAAVQEALAKASAAEGAAKGAARATGVATKSVPKDGREPVRAFLPTFRKLCCSSFCIGALEAIVRADGSAGPTIGTVLSALVKTGGSGILMLAFFHGLKQMSSAGEGASDSAVLANGADDT